MRQLIDRRSAKTPRWGETGGHLLFLFRCLTVRAGRPSGLAEGENYHTQLGRPTYLDSLR